MTRGSALTAAPRLLPRWITDPQRCREVITPQLERDNDADRIAGLVALAAVTQADPEVGAGVLLQPGVLEELLDSWDIDAVEVSGRRREWPRGQTALRVPDGLSRRRSACDALPDPRGAARGAGAGLRVQGRPVRHRPPGCRDSDARHAVQRLAVRPLEPGKKMGSDGVLGR